MRQQGKPLVAARLALLVRTGGWEWMPRCVMAEIRVEQLTKTFGALRAVDDVTFTFPDGQVTCLLGPSGCGKTTLMRIIAGLETQTTGEVFFGEQNVSRLSPSRRNVGMVFQYPVVYRGISVYRNIELPLQSMKLSKAERTRRVEDAIQLLGLTASTNLDVSKLDRSEEHTSELQSRQYLVCRLLL